MDLSQAHEGAESVTGIEARCMTGAVCSHAPGFLISFPFIRLVRLPGLMCGNVSRRTANGDELPRWVCSRTVPRSLDEDGPSLLLSGNFGCPEAFSLMCRSRILNAVGQAR